MLASAVAFRLPTTAVPYFRFYHDIPQRYASGFGKLSFMCPNIDKFTSSEDALAILNGDRELAEHNFCLSFDDCH
jgi:hypothetical protein